MKLNKKRIGIVLGKNDKKMFNNERKFDFTFEIDTSIANRTIAMRRQINQIEEVI